jgi:hypothetical protein
MALPYSTRFIAATLNSPASVSYVVPSGQRAIIRTVTYTAGATGGNSGVTQIAGSINLFTATNIAGYTSVVQDLHAVVNTGETITVQCFAGGLWITVSGYLLSTT